jgi:hypothetical protein
VWVTIFITSFKLCKVNSCKKHHYDINEHDFFNPMKDQNIQREKCDDDVCLVHAECKCEVLEPLDNRLWTQSKTQCKSKRVIA